MGDIIDGKSGQKKGVGRWYAHYVNGKGKHVPGRFSLEKEMAIIVPFNDKERVKIEIGDDYVCIRKL
jgi:hypothetical protein